MSEPIMLGQDRLFFVSGNSHTWPIRLMHADLDWPSDPAVTFALKAVPKPSWKLSPLARAAQGRYAKLSAKR